MGSSLLSFSLPSCVTIELGNHQLNSVKGQLDFGRETDQNMSSSDAVEV